MTRRSFVQLVVGVVGAGLVWAKKTVGIAASAPPLTIAQILVTSFPSVLAEMRGKNEWVSPELNQLARSGRLIKIPLGPQLQHTKPNGSTKNYDVSEIGIPMVWGKKNDDLPADKKIELVAALLENGIESHDDVLIGEIGSGLCFASKAYSYFLGEVLTLPDDRGFVCKLYTAAAFID